MTTTNCRYVEKQTQNITDIALGCASFERAVISLETWRRLMPGNTPPTTGVASLFPLGRLTKKASDVSGKPAQGNPPAKKRGRPVKKKRDTSAAVKKIRETLRQWQYSSREHYFCSSIQIHRADIHSSLPTEPACGATKGATSEALTCRERFERLFGFLALFSCFRK